MVLLKICREISLSCTVQIIDYIILYFRKNTICDKKFPKKTRFYQKMNLDRLAARVVFNKKNKKLSRAFSSKGSFLGGVVKNLIFNDHSRRGGKRDSAPFHNSSPPPPP